MPADDEEEDKPFYSAYGKISSRFAAEDVAEPTVDDMTVADFGKDGKVPKQVPSDSATLTLYVEHCTAERPTWSLKGSKAKYEECHANLEAAFLEQFAEWSPTALNYVNNPKPAQSPYVFLPPDKAVTYPGRINSFDAPCFVHELGEVTRNHLLDGTMVIDSSDFPPLLLKYPRIGALEVTYQLCESYRPIGQKLVFSKGATGKWPSTAKLMKQIALHVQMDLYRHSRSYAKAATEGRAKAEKCANELADAEAKMIAQQELADFAAKELAEAEQGNSSSDAATADARAQLASLQELAPLELQKVVRARSACDKLRVKHAGLLARAEIAEARMAMQASKKELLEWEASQKELEVALTRVESFAVAGESSNAREMREHAHQLRKSADRELSEARVANENATKELLEAMHAELHAAQAKLALCKSDLAGTEVSADAEELERRHAAVIGAEEGIVEARVRIEDAEAQAVMATADIEFKEAKSFMLQAKLARNEATHAPSGNAEEAAAHAAKLKQRALTELEDARQALNKAANEAIEAAEARFAKEVSEAQQAKADMTAAEAALASGKSNKKHTAGLEAEIKRLRKIVEREAQQAGASKLNVQITKRELSDKQAAIEEVLEEAPARDSPAPVSLPADLSPPPRRSQVVEKALAEEALEKEAQRKRELAAAAAKERDEADAAISHAARLDAMALEAEQAVTAATTRAEELVRQHGRHHPLANSALASERQVTASWWPPNSILTAS